MYLRRESDDFGSYLRAVRIKSGISQADLAKAANNVTDKTITQSVIAQYEANSIKNPDPAVVQVFSEVLKVPYGNFVALVAKKLLLRYQVDLSCMAMLLSDEDLKSELDSRKIK
jgi:transcriptional regulator with XRE-family HTH domain